MKFGAKWRQQSRGRQALELVCTVSSYDQYFGVQHRLRALGCPYSTGAAIWRFGTKLVYDPGEQPEWGGRPSGPDLSAADTESR